MTALLHNPAVSEGQGISKRQVLLRLVLRLSLRAVLFLVLGAVISILIAWAFALWSDPQTATVSTAAIPQHGRIWSISSWNSSGSLGLHFQREAHAWSGWQATGAPDTPMSGDCSLAWCPATADGQAEWLILDYPQAVLPKEVQIYENYAPGAVNRVSVFNENGQEAEAWRGQDPTPTTTTAGISKIPIKLPFKTQRVKIYIDSQKVLGWNEIDAVGLVDDAGNVQWASDVQDSSSYANATAATSTSAPAFNASMPDWCPLSQPNRTSQASDDDRIFEARGWPVLALWAERPVFPARLGLKPGLSLPSMPVSFAPILPMRPIWSGLLFDAIFVAAILAVTRWTLVKPRRLLLELLRMRRGCCISCGYQLDFDFRSGCPECGWRRSSEAH